MEDAEVKKVRNARRPTLQDVAGGEISLERYRASATGQSSARSNARRPTLRDVENGEISLEKYRASAQAQRNARQAPTLTPALKFKLVALGTELGEDAAEAATDRLFGWALSKLNLYKKLFPDGYLVNVGIGGAHTLKYGEMVPDFKGHVRVCASARPLTLHPYTPSTPSPPSASRPESGGAPADHAIRVPGAAGGGAVVVTARGQARLQQCLRVRTLSSLRRHTPLEVEPPPLRCRFLTSPEGLAMESSIKYVRFVPVVEVAESYTHFFLHDKRSGLADVAKLAVPPSSASDLPVWGHTMHSRGAGCLKLPPAFLVGFYVTVIPRHRLVALDELFTYQTSPLPLPPAQTPLVVEAALVASAAALSSTGSSHSSPAAPAPRISRRGSASNASLPASAANSRARPRGVPAAAASVRIKTPLKSYRFQQLPPDAELKRQTVLHSRASGGASKYYRLEQFVSPGGLFTTVCVSGRLSRGGQATSEALALWRLTPDRALSDKAYDDKVVNKLGQGKSPEAKVPDYYKVAKEFGPPVAVPAIRASEYFAEPHTPAGNVPRLFAAPQGPAAEAEAEAEAEEEEEGEEAWDSAGEAEREKAAPKKASREAKRPAPGKARCASKRGKGRKAVEVVESEEEESEQEWEDDDDEEEESEAESDYQCDVCARVIVGNECVGCESTDCDSWLCWRCAKVSSLQEAEAAEDWTCECCRG